MTKKEILDKIDDIRKNTVLEITQLRLEADEKLEVLRAELKEVIE